MKKFACILLLFIMIISLFGCSSTEPTIQYVEKEVLIKQCCGNEGIEYAPIDNINVAIICKSCGRELGELPVATIDRVIEKEIIVEKEVIKEVPIEVIIEKEIIIEKEVIKEIEKPFEVIIEKEIILPFGGTFLTWQDICNLKPGDKLANIIMVDGYFASNSILQSNGGHDGWEHIEFELISPAKLYYGNGIEFSRFFTYSICLFSGTIQSIEWNTDKYGNVSCEIEFGWEHSLIELDALNYKE